MDSKLRLRNRLRLWPWGQLKRSSYGPSRRRPGLWRRRGGLCGVEGRDCGGEALGERVRGRLRYPPRSLRRLKREGAKR